MATSTRQPAATAAALHAQHRELRETVAGLQRDLARPPGPDTVLEWCEIVSLRLRILRAHLKSHFAQEELGGLIEEIQRSAPEQRGACERLLGEHARLLERLDALATQASLRTGPASLADGLRVLIADLELHEERENELLLRALDATPGAPD